MPRLATGALSLAAVALLLGCARPADRASSGDTRATPTSATRGALSVDEPLQPLVPPRNLDPRAVALGRDLFHDARLSRDNTVSCASCHGLSRGGVDGLPRSIGIGGAVGTINAPTVLNSGANFRQFWNGRAATLEEQVDGPMQGAVEMGATWPQILKNVRANPDYVRRFRIYPDGVTQRNVQSAIATFERSLATPARFDRYLRGDPTAITEREREGYVIFKNYGCASCHQGANVGGNMYQTFGVMQDYFVGREDTSSVDIGRFAVTHADRDRHVFKVPSLRNVALTAPYFHDGSAPTLEVAVSVMGLYQLGRTLTPNEVELLVAFLNSLTGDIPPDAVSAARTSPTPRP